MSPLSELTVGFSNPSGSFVKSTLFSQGDSIWAWSDYSSVLRAIVPPVGPYNVSIANRDYVADTSFEPYRRDAFRHRSIPPQREGILFDNIPGEGSINPKGLWRRGMNDWSRGAGQIHLDRKLSVDNRYYQSKGINPWTPWQVTLLSDVKQPLNAGNPLVPDGTGSAGYNGFIKAIAVGGYVYIATTGTLTFTQDWNVFTSVNVSSIAATNGIVDIATDGYNVYLATNGLGLYSTTAGATTVTQYVTNGNLNLVRWVNQRIMVASGASIYNITAASGNPLPAALYTHPNTKWVWVDFAGGSSQIYAAGGVPITGPSAIFRTTISADATTLLPPIQALPLEGGELATCLGAYLNYIFVGTNLGVRMCETLAAYDPTGNQGDLRAGAIVPNITQPVTLPVTGIVGFGRFVWFTWNNYDSGSTGLGRLNLENFIDALTPTYASDLMIPSQGSILLDWDPISSAPLMALQGQQGIDTGGVWIQDPVSFVSSGTVDSGYISYDLPDDKVAMSLLAQVQPPLSGTVQASICVDQALQQNYGVVGIQSQPLPSAIKWPLNQVRGIQYQVRFTLSSTPDSDADADRDSSPILGHWTLKAFPAVSTGIEISAVLIMSREVVQRDLLRPFDPYAEYQYLETIRQNQQVIQYVEGPFMRNVIITSLDWLPNLEQVGGAYAGYNSYLIVYMESLPT